MGRILRLGVLFATLIVYIYSIVFVVFPISTKILLEVFALLLSVKYFISSNYNIKREYIIILRSFFFLILWDIFVCLVNGSTEFYLAKKVIPAIGAVFASHLIYKIFISISDNRVLHYFIIVIVILAESILAALMKVFPSLYSFIEGILQFEVDDSSLLESLIANRLIGIGNAAFFGVLVSCALGLMLSVYLMPRVSLFNRIILIVSWIIIFSVSFLTARYSIFVGMISLLFYVMTKNIFKSIALISICSFLSWVIYLYILDFADPGMIDWAFGAFVKNGGSSSNTVEVLIHWWTKTEIELKTFLIGDGRYVGLNGEGYYMNVDIGIFRQIFYGGLIGLFLNLRVHALILKKSYYQRKEKDFKFFVIFLFFCYIAILTKGDASMITFFILILVIETGGVFNKRNKYVEN